MKNLVYIFWVSALVLAGTAGVSAQESDRRDVRRGNREFRDGNYREAAVEYQKALLRDSTSFAASYNLANALYRMENWQEARSVLDSVSKAAEVSGHASDYWYNSGNTAATLKDWQAAVDAYKESLLRNPGDLEAKENYIYAKEMLENQQNQQLRTTRIRTIRIRMRIRTTGTGMSRKMTAEAARLHSHSLR